ncbi:hypothetical protein [Bradyrhizobium sp. B120]|uniref:hypothetical protein n=1 Tax=Bradyrhizobium sp. B120 TaxID=3410088 RepID=UPI003B97E389
MYFADQKTVTCKCGEPLSELMLVDDQTTGIKFHVGRCLSCREVTVVRSQDMPSNDNA